jgi:LysM repeat protein
MTRGGQNLSRWLAPLALVACALAVVMILGSGGAFHGSGSSADAPAVTQPRSAASTAAKKRGAGARRKKRRTYTVRAGDTLSGIAQKTGVPLSELQAMNPTLDSESLQTGQKVKLAP